MKKKKVSVNPPTPLKKHILARQKLKWAVSPRRVCYSFEILHGILFLSNRISMGRKVNFGQTNVETSWDRAVPSWG